MDLNNKVIIVTGASSGIGAATVKLLSSKGAKIALIARRVDKINNLAKEISDALAITADMSKETEVRKMIEKVYDHFGCIDILINNAGQGYSAPIEKIEINKYHYLFDLNVVGPLVAMQSVIPIMKKQGGGAIINISSGTAFMSIPNLAVYSSTKRALNGLSLTAHAELAKDNIKVSAVYPYITTTEFYQSSIKAESNSSARFVIDDDRPPADSAEFVAEKILEAINSGVPELFVHDWMKNNRL